MQLPLDDQPDPISRERARSSALPLAPFDPFAAVDGDTLAHYRRLVREAPVQRTAAGFWAVSGYRAARAALAAPELSSRPSEWATANAVRGGDPTAKAVQRALLSALDPPEHTLVRGLVRSALAQLSSAPLEAYLDAEADRLLEPGLPTELVSHFAEPYARRIVSHVLGLPVEVHGRLAEWSRWGVALAEPVSELSHYERMAQVAREMSRFVNDWLPHKRAQPGADLTSALLAAEHEGSRLSVRDLTAFLVLFIAGSHSSVVNLIALGLAALLEAPIQLERLRVDPSAMGGAIEELLRWTSPVQVTGRTATQDLTLAGHLIRAGSPVFVILAAANRDPAQFDRPDELDIARRDNAHLAFGVGAHSCLGAGLSRMAGRAALSALLRRFPDLVADGPPGASTGRINRRLSALRLRRAGSSL